MRATANKNRVLTSLIGQGYHGTIMPPAIQRNILENPAWYTAYTPYQAEISQGRLEALLNFQTLVSRSDRARCRQCLAARRGDRRGRGDGACASRHQVEGRPPSSSMRSACRKRSPCSRRAPSRLAGRSSSATRSRIWMPRRFSARFSNIPAYAAPSTTSPRLIAKLHAAKALAVVAADPLALTLLKPPGEMGADIAVGSMQRFGMPMGYGGPHAAYIAVKDAYKRALPGRIVGVSIDARGNRAYRLALQTREQHIRRESATSNICTAQVLPAVISSMYAVFHGPKGLKAIAERVHRKAARLADGLASLGFKIRPESFFDTITVDVGPYQGLIMKNAVDNGVNLRKVGRDRIGITVDERTRPATLEAVWRAFGGYDLVYRDEYPEYRLPKSSHSPISLFDASGLPHEPGGERDDALHAPSRRPGSGARPRDDPARLMHDEAQCDGRDAAHHVAGVRRDSPVRASRSGHRLCRADQGPVREAVPDHGLRRDLDAAKLRRARRVRGPACDPRLPQEPRGSASQRLPHPRLGARHQPGIGIHVRHEGRRGRDGRRRQYRRRRLPRQGRGERAQTLRRA